MGIGWRLAMQNALYGPDGFFVRADAGPADHFRTSVHASPLFAAAVAAPDQPRRRGPRPPRPFDVVDVGAGRGELLTALHAALGADLADRIRLAGVEKAAAAGRAERRRSSGGATCRTPSSGVLLATEWLDNVPLDVAEVDEAGRLRRVLVDRRPARRRLGAAGRRGRPDAGSHAGGRPRTRRPGPGRDRLAPGRGLGRRGRGGAARVRAGRRLRASARATGRGAGR